MPHDDPEKDLSTHDDHQHPALPSLGLSARMRAIAEGKADPGHGATGHVCGAGCEGHHSHSHGHDDHHHSHDHSHHHHHHDHSHDGPETFNYGTLTSIFSLAGVKADSWLERHRSKFVLGAAGALAGFEYLTTGATSQASQIFMIAGAGLVAHDASEDLMEATGKLNESHNLSTGVVGLGVGVAHTVSEGLLTLTSKMSAYEDVAVSTIMGSNVSHIPLMAGMAGLIGSLSIDKSYAYKMNAVFMGGVTAAFGYQIATGDFNPWLSGATAAAGGTYLLWRVSAGQTCAVHGDACGHVHHGPKNETDYISLGYLQDLTSRTVEGIKNISYDAAAARPKQITQKTDRDISSPRHQGMLGKVKSAWQAVSHENVVTLTTSLAALGLSAHVLGNNVIKLAETGGISTTAMGATVAALSYALPELILTGKAAWKKDGEMAWGAVTGCTVATVGIVGGLQGLSGFDVPSSLSLATTEGKVMMAAFAGSAAAIIASVHPWSARQMAKADNILADGAGHIQSRIEDVSSWLKNNGAGIQTNQPDAQRPFEKLSDKIASRADWFQRRAEGVSNWLRNDGTKLSKVAAAPMLASALTFYAYGILPICHAHGQNVHCFNPNPANIETPEADDARQILERVVPLVPDF